MNIQQPIKNTDQFIGRETFISKIYSRIGATRPQSVSIVGDYKIGKTSLVNFLTADQTKASYLNNPGQYIYISVSISARNIQDIDSFVDGVTTEIFKKTTLEYDKSVNYYDWFKKAAELLTARDQKLIFFFDDFNIITQNENFPLEFFSFLRSMANNYNVAYVTTSYHDLQKLCVSKDVEESPFFNIFTNMTLKAMSRQETDQLVNHLVNGINTQAREELFNYCGGFPYQIKVACNALSSEKANPDDFKATLYLELKGYYEELFSRFDAPYQKILKRLAAGVKIPSEQQFLFNDLERKDYVHSNNGKPYLYSEIFGRFIAEKFNLKIKNKTPFFNKLFSLFKKN